jgi:hypothetical protein
MHPTKYVLHGSISKQPLVVVLEDYDDGKPSQSGAFGDGSSGIEGVVGTITYEGDMKEAPTIDALRSRIENAYSKF